LLRLGLMLPGAQDHPGGELALTGTPARLKIRLRCVFLPFVALLNIGGIGNNRGGT
jgi:hypothetical protein